MKQEELYNLANFINQNDINKELFLSCYNNIISYIETEMLGFDESIEFEDENVKVIFCEIFQNNIIPTYSIYPLLVNHEIKLGYINRKQKKVYSIFDCNENKIFINQIKIFFNIYFLINKNFFLDKEFIFNINNKFKEIAYTLLKIKNILYINEFSRISFIEIDKSYIFDIKLDFKIEFSILLRNTVISSIEDIFHNMDIRTIDIYKDIENITYQYICNFLLLNYIYYLFQYYKNQHDKIKNELILDIEVHYQMLIQDLENKKLENIDKINNLFNNGTEV